MESVVIEMFNHLQYVPVLKWKLGEYQALSRLKPEAKDRITPLIELPPIGYDFEKHQTAKSQDQHLADFGKRLKSKWQGRPCFIDLKYLDHAELMADGTHAAAHVWKLARKEGCHVIPVVSLSSDGSYLNEAAKANTRDHHGICVRLELEDFDRPNLGVMLQDVLTKVGVAYSESDLVIDLGDKQLLPVKAFVQVLMSLMKAVPALNRWRTLTVCGTAYPATLASISNEQLVRRHEWTVYRTLVNELGDGTRIPTFGDYAVAHPDPVELDMRLIKPFAKLRYTTSEEWYIAKGRPVRTAGFEQYRAICNQLADQPFFDGAEFSEGDRYIADCAAGNAPTGNLTTWVWVSTNRHLSKVVDDLATFHGA